MNLLELLGIIENSKALNTVGTYCRLYEILTLAGLKQGDGSLFDNTLLAL